MRKVIAASAGALILTFALSGCITIQVPGIVGQGQPNGSVIDCDETEKVTESGSYVLAGRCPDLTVEGTDIQITGEEIVDLEVQGDRIAVTAVEVGELLVDGNSNIVVIDSLDDAQVTGDRNSISTIGILPRAIINGHDNKIAADGGVIDVFDNGERTEIQNGSIG